MSNLFDFNFIFSYGMNHSFIPNFSISNFLQPLKISDIDLSFSIFKSLKLCDYITAQCSLSNSSIIQFASSNSTGSGNIDTFESSASGTAPKTNNSGLDEYNEDKGKKLARIAQKNSVGWKGLCATYVKNAIKKAGLGKCADGHAYQMIELLRENKNFKEISPDTDLNSLPEGCVLVYGKGVAKYSKDYGHTEITVFNKRTKKIQGVSDGITINVRENPSAIFIPV